MFGFVIKLNVWYANCAFPRLEPLAVSGLIEPRVFLPSLEINGNVWAQ